MAEKNFVNGMIFKMPRDNAPDFVKGSLSVKVDEFIQYAQQNARNGWLNVDLKVSQTGKPYAELNTWEPANKSPEETKKRIDEYHSSKHAPSPDFDDDLPF